MVFSFWGSESRSCRGTEVRPFYASILVQIQQLIHEKETPQPGDGELKRPRSLFGPLLGW